jgi:NADH-quinone oxidoreductase subunit H
MECENELVAGYQTEYSSMKFGLFYLGEYAHLLFMSALLTTLFFGGWQGPVIPGPAILTVLSPIIWFLLKTFIFVFIFVWIRGTYPRLRYDRVMSFGWKVLIPLGFVNIAWTVVWILWLQTPIKTALGFS